MKRIVIKIGSKVLTGKDNQLNKEVVSSLVKDIVKIKKEKNIDVILVTSGAVALGRSVNNLENFKIESAAIKYNKAIVKEQILAAIGQPKLMAFYIAEFKKYGFTCAQLLATRAVFADREAYLSLRTVTENLLKLDIIPIFNENDALSPEELDFSDNDQLSSMIAAMVVADKLILLSDVDGVYENLSNGSKTVVKEISNIHDYMEKVDDSGSLGKGGMKSKLLTADIVTSLGITMQIANGQEKKVVSRIIGGENIGTVFPAKNKKTKALKSWLMTSAVSQGKIYVNSCLAEVLKKKQTCSILFLGITKVEGNFKNNEVVEICDDNRIVFGKGLARFGKRELTQRIALYNKLNDAEKTKIKAAEIVAVHYDYFSFVG